LSFGFIATIVLLILTTFLLVTQIKFFKKDISLTVLLFTFFAQAMINVNSIFVNSVFAFTYVVMKNQSKQGEQDK
jgi:hypothetical protein